MAELALVLAEFVVAAAAALVVLFDGAAAAAAAGTVTGELGTDNDG